MTTLKKRTSNNEPSRFDQLASFPSFRGHLVFVYEAVSVSSDSLFLTYSTSKSLKLDDKHKEFLQLAWKAIQNEIKRKIGTLFLI